MVRGLIGQAARAYFAPKGRAPLSAPSSGEQRGEPTSQHGAATCRKLWFKWQSVGERKLQKVSTANWLGYPERHQGPAKGRVKGTKCKLNLLFLPNETLLWAASWGDAWRGLHGKVLYYVQFERCIVSTDAHSKHTVTLIYLSTQESTVFTLARLLGQDAQWALCILVEKT